MDWDFHIFNILWNIIGVLCLIVLFWLTKRLIKALRGESWRHIAMAITAGLISSVLTAIMLLWLFGVYLGYWLIDWNMTSRLIIAVVITYILAWGLGVLLGRILRSFCKPAAVIYASLIGATLIGFQPIGYGWLKGLAGLLIS